MSEIVKVHNYVQETPYHDGVESSIFDMLRGRFRDAVQAIPEDLWVKTDMELKRELRPTDVDYKLRVALWQEYEKAVKAGRNVICVNYMLEGVCTDAYFYQKFLKSPLRVAWLMKPVQNYAKEIESILLRGTERLWELMGIDIYKKNRDGEEEVCPKLATVLLETIKMVEARAKGHAMQRSEMRAVSVSLAKKVGENSVQDLNAMERRIKELTKKIHGRADVVMDEEEIEGLSISDAEA